MPAYNAAKYLDSAIESIVNQTYSDYELIVINDGSTDNTLELIQKWATTDNRIKIIDQENRGIVKSLNRALIDARGEYIARMDADDLCLPQRLERQLAAFSANPQLIACGTWFQKIDANNKHILTISNPPIKDHHCKELLLLQNCFAHPSIMLRRNGAPSEKLVYNDAYLYAEDYKLWSDIAEYGQFYNIPERLLLYRIHGNQTSSRKLDTQQKVHALIASENLINRGVPTNTDEVHQVLWSRGFFSNFTVSVKLIGSLVARGKLSIRSAILHIARLSLKKLVRRLYLLRGYS